MNTSGFADLTEAGGILLGLDVAGKDDLLVALTGRAGEISGLPATRILERVREREALGTTGFGQGAAIPHARMAGLDRVLTVVAQLVRPLDYAALDGEPVDIVVLLLSPEGAGADHLKALARISRALRDPSVLGAMRTAPDEETMRSIIGPLMPPGQRAA
jgi:PTS system nitrogen regulatory IIA component